MNHCSFFIKDKALFGSYPTQESVNELEENGVTYFIDLTSLDEKKVTKYKTSHKYVHYPINDRNVPENPFAFCKFILNSCEDIRNSRKSDLFYVHCRAGHGRSGIAVASILSHIFNMLPHDALSYTNKCHNNRSIMRDKWRKIGSPQTYQQKKYIYKLFQPISLVKIFKNGINSYEVIFDNYPKFDNIFNAFAYFKELFIINKLKVLASFKLKDVNVYTEWEEVKEKIMYYIVYKLVESNKEIKNNLINTYLRPIQAHLEHHDTFWGIKSHYGENKLGKILNNIRNKLIREMTDEQINNYIIPEN